MTEVSSLLSPPPIGGDSNVLAVKAYTGLHLEPPTRDLVSRHLAHRNKQNIYFQFAAASGFAQGLRDVLSSIGCIRIQMRIACSGIVSRAIRAFSQSARQQII